MSRTILRTSSVLLLALGATLANVSASSGSAIDMKKLEAMKPRSIGPAAMSGRVTAIAVDPRNGDVIYIGSASGGIWKSKNGGITWEPIFDDQGSASIGDLAIDPGNPDVVWAGTGEGNPRNSQSVGDGIYRSLDGGKSWKRLGLEKTEHIHRVIVHPRDSRTVYVGATGPTWGDGTERGVFKTTDGGKTWKKILYVNERTGVGDLVMDPSNPDKLIAAMWEHRRRPWDFKSGGPGSGVHITHDGGETWEERTDEDGLPKGELGRIGLAIAASDSNRIYALVESKKNALYRSDDGGVTWKKINDKANIGNRPFYYYDIRVDPTNENRLYSLHSTVTYSQDGGRNFESLVPFAKAHPDHHAFWINPDNPNHLIDGNDGGLYISKDMGKNWRFAGNLPLGQFYHVNVDMQTPYNVFGGLQDNGSFVGPNAVWEGFIGGGILNAHWKMVSFGDGFDVVPDPSDPRYGYSMSQGGNLYRFDMETGGNKTIRPPDPKGERLRFNWNAGIAVDPFDKKTVYYGSQHLHQSRDRGESWETISPDLTTNDPEKQKQLDSGGLTFDVTNAENHTTIIAVAPSPVQKGVIWVGTDDGNVQVTRDGGRNWTNVVKNISGVPEGTWVPHIEASKFSQAEAFVVFDDHRRSNWKPYVYKTTDFGATWTSLATDDLRGFVYVVEQDPEVENLLFLGTEFHLYFSIDGGQTWNRWESAYPTVPTRDLVVHPRDGDLIIATFGRAFFVLDDIGPLREMARQGADVLDRPLHLFPVPVAVQAQYSAPPGELIAGDTAFRGENRPNGALITYVVNTPEAAESSEPEAGGPDGDDPAEDGSEGPKKPEKVKVEILEGETVIRTLDGESKNGLNRMTWSMDRKGVRFPSRTAPQPDADEPGGIPVLPGTYTVRVSRGEESSTQTVRVLPDPRNPVPEADMKAKWELVQTWMKYVNSVTEANERLRDSKSALDRINELLEDRKDKRAQAVKDSGKDVGKALKALREKIIPARVQGIRRDPELVTSALGRASSYLQSSWDAPNATEKEVMVQTGKRVDSLLAEVQSFFDGPWAEYQKKAGAAKISLFPEEKGKILLK